MHRKARGFTLLELLVVLAVIGLMAATGIPYALDTVHRMKVVQAVDCSANMLRTARLLSIRRNVTASVRMEQTTVGTTTITRIVGTAGDDMPGTCLMPAQIEQTTVDGWAANAGEALFLPTGAGAEDGAFRFRDMRGNELEVRLAPAAVGRIQIRKFDGTNWVGKDRGGWKWH